MKPVRSIGSMVAPMIGDSGEELESDVGDGGALKSERFMVLWYEILLVTIVLVSRFMDPRGFVLVHFSDYGLL